MLAIWLMMLLKKQNREVNKMQNINRSFKVFVQGVLVNDGLLVESEAQELAKSWINDGYHTRDIDIEDCIMSEVI